MTPGYSPEHPTRDVATPSIEFSADWHETVTGRLQAGESFVIDYDPQRLPHCRSRTHGAPAWAIVAFIQFNPGQEPGQVPVTTPGTPGGVITKQLASVAIPADAAHLRIWFMNSDVAGCVAWDSNFGANYAFDLG